MDTNLIEVKGSFKKTKLLMEGGDIFKQNCFNISSHRYISYLRDNGNAESSIKQDFHYIVTLLLYFERKEINTFKDIKKSIIHEFIVLYDYNGYSYAYSDRNKMNIRLFFNWLYENKLIKFSGDMILPKIMWRTRNKVVEAYSKEEVEKLLNSIDISTNDGKELYLILCLICYLGLRISDVVDLKLSDIDFNRGIISKIQYKTKNLLILPLINEVKLPLIDYIENVRPKDGIDYIFVDERDMSKPKISIKNQGNKVRKAMINANIDIGNRQAGFHVLRHSLSRMLLELNTPIDTIASILGHLHVSSSMSYLDIDINKLKELALEVPIC